MANGATVRARDRATRDCAALTETLKKIDPARAIATMASPADESPWTSASRPNGGISLGFGPAERDGSTGPVLRSIGG